MGGRTGATKSPAAWRDLPCSATVSLSGRRQAGGAEAAARIWPASNAFTGIFVAVLLVSPPGRAPQAQAQTAGRSQSSAAPGLYFLG